MTSDFYGFDDALAALGKDEPIVFIEPDHVEVLHDKLLSRFHGMRGVRDRKALEGACARPLQILAYGDNPSIFMMATSLCSGIVGSHPFIDGNKRTAFTAMVEMLNMNNYAFQTNNATLYNMMIGLAAGKISDGEFTSWVEHSAVSFELLRKPELKPNIQAQITGLMKSTTQIVPMPDDPDTANPTGPKPGDR